MKLNDNFARAFLMPWEESFFGALVQLIKCVHKFRKNPVREVKARVRPIASAVKKLTGLLIKPDMPVSAWLIMRAAMSMNVGRKGLG